MLELRFVVENPEVVRKDLKKRGMLEKLSWVDELIELDKKRRDVQKKLDDLRHKKNELSLLINKNKKEGKDISNLIKESSELPKRIRELEGEFKNANQRIRYLLMRIPNILDESVPIGKDDSENVEIKRVGTPKKFDFELKPHGVLAEELDIADFKRAAKVVGSGFVYLKNELALLDLALQRFAIEFLIKRGFTFVEPPFMLGREAYEGVTSLDDFEQVMYKIEGEDRYMIATAEHPLVSMFMNETIDEDKLPLRFVGFSPCFRREIGSHGVDTKGLFRMHQFNKVEQVVFSTPEQSQKIFEELQKNTEDMFAALGIPYRVVNICTGDMGIVASKKHDIEAWFPREKAYKEVASCSNCKTYQAVRLNIKVRRKDGTREYLHTLNNTGIATSRAMRAILENYQNRDGTVDIPEVLQPYMMGISKIKKH